MAQNLIDMLKRVAISAFLVCFAGAAGAADDQAAEDECIGQLMKAETLVYEKIEAEAISEADAEEATRHLDDADAACSNGDFDDAMASLDSISSMLSKPEE